MNRRKGNLRDQIFALAFGVLLHIMVVLTVFILQRYFAEKNPELLTDLLPLGGSGGGGADDNKQNEKSYTIELGPIGDAPPNEETKMIDDHPVQFQLLRIHIKPPEVEAPKVEEKIIIPEKRKKLVSAPKVPTYTPKRRIRGAGPGSDGGIGGGSGGGIGAGKGFSIDWGGGLSRRLLSGKLPVYPEGSEKQMKVTMTFSVLPDGTVSEVHPVRKSDEKLERAAIVAINTWRFDALPPEYEQKIQRGEVTINFTVQ